MEIATYIQSFKTQFGTVQEAFYAAANTYCKAVSEHGEKAEKAFRENFNLKESVWELLKQVGLGIIPKELIHYAKFPFAKYAANLKQAECKKILEEKAVPVAVGKNDSRMCRLPDLTKDQCRNVFDVNRGVVRSLPEQRALAALRSAQIAKRQKFVEGTKLDADKVKFSQDGSGAVTINGYRLTREMLVDVLNLSSKSMN